MVGVFAGGGIVDIDVFVAFFGESGLFGGSEARSFGAVEDEDASIFVNAWVVAEHGGNIGLNRGIIASTTTRKNVRDTIDTAGGHVIWVEGDLAHTVEVKIGSEVGKSFHFVDREIGAEIVAESGSEAEEVGEGKIFGEDFIFDADEDFLLGSAAGEIATSGAVTSTSKTEGLTAVDSIGDAGVEDGASVIIVVNTFI